MSIIGDYLDSKAQKTAANSILSAYDDATDESIAGYKGARDASLGYYQPYMQTGQNALARADQMQQPGFQYNPSDPSYAWRFGEGMNALNRSAAATGSLQSGGQQKALMRYGQGLASTEFQADFNRNNTLAGYGMQAAQGSAQAQDRYASGNANALFNGANGKAGGYQAKADAKSAFYGSVDDAASSAAQMYFFGF